MGDRALVIFHSDNAVSREYSPVVYLHWAGSQVPDYLKALADLMKDRRNDVSYACARFIGICHVDNVSSLSLGVWNIPADFKEDAEYLTNLSHGDAGLILVNTKDFSYRVFGGYLESSN